MVEQAFDRSNERAELELISRREQRRRRAVLRQHAMIACAENDRDKSRGITEGQPAGEPCLDGFVSWVVHALQARGQRRRVVGDDEVGRLEQGGQGGARQMRDHAVMVGDEQLGGRHGRRANSRGAFSRSAPSIEATISCAASSGRFRVAGSASGTARA